MTYKLFWGELHTHSNCSVDCRQGADPETLIHYARRFLDFFALADHNQCPDAPSYLASHLGTSETSGKIAAMVRNGIEGRLLKDTWGDTQRLIAENNEPGRFVTFLGYEWSSFKYGDHNIYYLNDYEPCIPAKTPRELYNNVKGKPAIIIPHHPAYPLRSRGIDWQYVKEEFAPVVEIFSMHGSSENDTGPYPMLRNLMGPRVTEGTIFEMLKRGLKLGFIASSDSHGIAAPYGRGYTGIFAKELSREALWKGLINKKTIAVTGDRIEISLRVNEGFIGDIIQGREKRRIEVKVEGWHLLDKVELVRNGIVIYRETCALNRPQLTGRIRFRISFGWSSEAKECRLNLSLSAGRITRVLFSSEGNPEYSIKQKDTREVELNLMTKEKIITSFLFEVEAPQEAKLNLKANDKLLKCSMKELLNRSFSLNLFRLYDTWMKLHQGWTENLFSKSFSIEDERDGGSVDAYYIRVTQLNGQMAWCSPIWVEKETTKERYSKVG